MTCKTYHVFEQQHRKGAVGHCVGTAVSSFPFPALPATRWLCAGILDYRSQARLFLAWPALERQPCPADAGVSGLGKQRCECCTTWAVSKAARTGDGPCTDADVAVHANVALLSSPNPCTLAKEGQGVSLQRSPSLQDCPCCVCCSGEESGHKYRCWGAVHFGCSWRSWAREECAGDSTLVFAVFGNIYSRLKCSTSVTNVGRHTTLTELIQFSSGVELGLFMPGWL